MAKFLVRIQTTEDGYFERTVEGERVATDANVVMVIDAKGHNVLVAPLAKAFFAERLAG